MIIHIMLFAFGLIGILDGMELIKTSYKKRGWFVLIAGILAIIISVEQGILYLFFDRPTTSVAIWSSQFMYNITFFIWGILLFILGINLIKTGGSYQKIKGTGSVIGGALIILYSLLEIIFR